MAVTTISGLAGDGSVPILRVFVFFFSLPLNSFALLWMYPTTLMSSLPAATAPFFFLLLPKALIRAAATCACFLMSVYKGHVDSRQRCSGSRYTEREGGWELGTAHTR